MLTKNSFWSPHGAKIHKTKIQTEQFICTLIYYTANHYHHPTYQSQVYTIQTAVPETRTKITLNFLPLYGTHKLTNSISQHKTDKDIRATSDSAVLRKQFKPRDLRSFDSNSNRTIPIRFESDGPIQNFRISRTCRRTTNRAHCSTKNFNHCN